MRYILMLVVIVILLLAVLQPAADAGMFLSPPTEFVSPICKWHFMEAPPTRIRLPLLLKP